MFGYLDSEQISFKLMFLQCISDHYNVYVCLCWLLMWQCSVSCDEGIQQRQVVCKASDNTIGECEGEKPETVLICKLGPCPGESHVHVIRQKYVFNPRLLLMM